MNLLLEEALVAARFSPRMYAAPFVGALRGAIREVRRVRRQMDRQQRMLRARHSEMRDARRASDIGSGNAK